MTGTRAASSGAVAFGAVVAFVVAVWSARCAPRCFWIPRHAGCLPDSCWAFWVVGAPAAAGAVAAALFFRWGRSPLSDTPLIVSGRGGQGPVVLGMLRSPS